MAITNGYCTLNDVKSALRIPTADTLDDALLEIAVESASRAIDAYCNRVFYNMGSSVRYYSATDPYFCSIDDLISITELATAVTSNGNYDTVWANYVNGAPGDYQLEPLNAQYPTDGIESPTTGIRAKWRYLFPTLGGNALVRVTGTWGWSAIPITIKQATVIQASRIFKRNDSPLGVLSAPDLGYIRVGSKLDPDVAQLIDSYRRVNGVA